MDRYEEYRCLNGIYNILIFSEDGDIVRILVSETFTEATKIGKEHSEKKNRFYVIYKVLKNSLMPYARWEVKTGKEKNDKK